ncbi:hypothetical protein [Mesomycoplasma hyorhinis]|uniref:hypothetical protein n=1 Tax=Mesomycoplasma hyorhinis TaxID=2100 RepID=UPI001C04CB04|nr:hypothetical protein [Mesomycoplasma hyorhinis]
MLNFSGYILFFINYYSQKPSKKVFLQILALVEILIISYQKSQNKIFDTIKMRDKYFEWGQSGKLYVLSKFISIVKSK